MDELILIAAVALPLLAVGAIAWLSIRRVGRHLRLSQRTAAGIVVCAGVCALFVAGLWLAVDGLTWRPVLYAITGLGLIALHLPRMRRRAGP